mgnify:FL=1|jgi:hypothetical protein
MFIKKDDVVQFIGCSHEQVLWGNNDDPNEVLEIGNTYKVSSVEVHKQHTKLTIEGYSGRFNSVCFSKEYAE